MNTDFKNIAKFPLDIPQGYYVVCVMQTQAAYAYRIRIVDENEVDIIKPMERRSRLAIPPLWSDISSFNKSKCYVVIEVSESKNVDSRIVVNDFNGMDDALKVRNYTVVVEDDGDYDYNDLFLTITAYSKRG